MAVDLSRFQDSFFSESAEHVETIQSGLLALEQRPKDLDLLNRVFRRAHSIKGNAGMFQFTCIAELTHRMENILDDLRNEKLSVTPHVVDVLLRALDGLKSLLDAAQGGEAVNAAKGMAAKYILATVKAARTVFVKGVMTDAGKGGMKPNKIWVKDAHGMMLPAQFVKELGKEIKAFDLSLVGTDPLYASNASKSTKEKGMLSEFSKGKEKVLVAEDGGTTVGISVDYAIVDNCGDCHNTHPKTMKTD